MQGTNLAYRVKEIIHSLIQNSTVTTNKIAWIVLNSLFHGIRNHKLVKNMIGNRNNYKSKEVGKEVYLVSAANFANSSYKLVPVWSGITVNMLSRRSPDW